MTVIRHVCSTADVPSTTAPAREVQPHKLRRTLYWLTQDWIFLKREMPIPVVGQKTRTSNVRTYGHPAEWASGQCTRIAWVFWSWHDYVATLRGETRPKTRSTTREVDIIVAAWRYLEPRLDELLDARRQLPPPYAIGQTDWAVSDDALQEIFDLHAQIRSSTGQTNRRFMLPVPCPSVDCGLKTLERVRGMGEDYIVCASCGYRTRHEHYPMLIRIMVDTLTNTEVGGE